MPEQKRVAVLLPCYNEEKTIEKVVADFKKALPSAQIYVFDNNSKDQSATLAKRAGAQVIPSPRQGKGHVVRHMFRVIDADLYIMADADDTYPADQAEALIHLCESRQADMVVGTRLQSFSALSFRKLHKFGNDMFSWLISVLFQVKVTDVLSGYRVFSRDFVKSVPLRAGGFDIESELTIQAAAKGFHICETSIVYGNRPEGSHSKLNTFQDGWVILKRIFWVFKDYRPLFFFSVISFLLGLASLGTGLVPIYDYLTERYVYHVPLALLAATLGILSALLFGIGLILDSVYKYHAESFELWKKNLLP